jgi:hypothetical protein
MFLHVNLGSLKFRPCKPCGSSFGSA